MRCSVEACPKEIPPAKLMCELHWAAVPRDLKLHIWVLYETGYGRGTTPWQAAVISAASAARKAVPSPIPVAG